MRGISRFINYLLCIPKSIYVNARLCPKHLWKLPILVSYKTKINDLSGNAHLQTTHIYPGMIRFGFSSIEHFDTKTARCILSIAGDIEFSGKSKIGTGTALHINRGAYLKLGANIKISSNSKVLCSDSIVIGDNALISWDVLIMDSNQHNIFHQGQPSTPQPISIGDNVWVGCRSYIGKGVHIANNNVIAANAVVIKSTDEEGCIIAGHPAQKIRDGITWQE